MYSESDERYNNSEKGIERRKRYEKSEKGKEARRRYYQSDAAKEKRRERDRRYRLSKKAKEKNKRYNNSKKGRERYKRYWNKWPERKVARKAVFDAIQRGDLPTLESQSCACGALAESYHHHKGYGRQHYLDVIPLCWSCHYKEHQK